jgi:hypothetical protein
MTAEDHNELLEREMVVRQQEMSKTLIQIAQELKEIREALNKIVEKLNLNQ